jgi:hypothetical protein
VCSEVFCKSLFEDKVFRMLVRMGFVPLGTLMPMHIWELVLFCFLLLPYTVWQADSLAS